LPLPVYSHFVRNFVWASLIANWLYVSANGGWKPVAKFTRLFNKFPSRCKNPDNLADQFQNNINVTEKERREILEEWLKQYKGLIFKVVRAYTVVDYDDLFQEIMIQVWNSIPVFRHEASVTTWLYRIALNTAIKWTKKEKRHDGVEKLDNVQHLLQESKTPIDERLTWLYGEIYKLDKIDRSITLLLLEGFSYKEMSNILGISESNVGVKINRIKKHLISRSKNYDNHGVR